MDIESLWTMKDNPTKPPVSSLFVRALVALLLLLATASFAMNRVYNGHYASGSAAWTIADGHIYKGHYASGAAKFTYDKDHLWRGHYASGAAIATWDSRDEIPDGVLAFIATQLVE